MIIFVWSLMIQVTLIKDNIISRPYGIWCVRIVWKLHDWTSCQNILVSERLAQVFTDLQNWILSLETISLYLWHNSSFKILSKYFYYYYYLSVEECYWADIIETYFLMWKGTKYDQQYFKVFHDIRLYYIVFGLNDMDNDVIITDNVFGHAEKYEINFLSSTKCQCSTLYSYSDSG